MARPRKINKAKEPIRLRMKDLSNGNKSLYLDIYRAGKRSYEYLKMYLIPETDYNAKMQNQATLTAANAIKSKRIIEIINSEAGIKQETDTSKVYLLDWMETYMENQAKRGKKDRNQIKKTIDILKAYGAETVTMDMIDKPFCQGYINYLTTEYRPKGKTVSNFTIHTYYQVVNGALNAAVRADILSENPFNKISSSEKIHKPESKREYMTIDEVRSLIKTPTSNEAVKGAYLFSCFCGLRISDIKGLTWENVYCDSGQYHLEVMMQKTKSPLYLPLSSEALKWLPERGNKSGKEKVFKLPSSAGINKLLKTWAQKAGVSKHITFCTARHTFATMMLTLGADLYTTSKLLGHTDMRTTQIYAKIVNRKKDEAVNLVNGLFG
ncbi:MULTISPECIES: site-specific integrase [Bacteroides]|uniref:site-specific integrase n=1 Tax=Bacteroides TaxID=816 RepID=UPI000B394E10|nr:MULTISPECIES: site-specific integrase [Bacteroides]MBM6944057.1 site-specific integrase [Bacteroides gallinaceum]OUO62716.1 recombinase [Bacteroides sp. An279]